MNGNNAHWVKPNIISHQGFYLSYDRCYFTPQGKFLCYTKWKHKDRIPKDTKVYAETYDGFCLLVMTDENEDVQNTIKEAMNATIIGPNRSFTSEEHSNSSPYIVFPNWPYTLPQLQKLYFSEHTTEDKENMLAIVAEMFPVQPEDKEYFDNFIKPYLIDNEQSSNQGA